MSRYIDADEFEDELYEHEFSNWCDKDEVSELIDNMPSADVEPVRHGRWLDRTQEPGVAECSVCGSAGMFWMNYCPNCGAKMDKGARA